MQKRNVNRRIFLQSGAAIAAALAMNPAAASNKLFGGTEKSLSAGTVGAEAFRGHERRVFSIIHNGTCHRGRLKSVISNHCDPVLEQFTVVFESLDGPLERGVATLSRKGFGTLENVFLDRTDCAEESCSLQATFCRLTRKSNVLKRRA